MRTLIKVVSLTILALACAGTSPAETGTSQSSPRMERHVKTRTLTHSDTNDTYTVSLYYSDYFKCVRIEVTQNGRSLTGLFNRFYNFKPVSDFTAELRKHKREGYALDLLIGRVRDDGQLSGSGNALYLVDSKIDTETVYNTVEAFVGVARHMFVYRPPGLLKKSCIARIFEPEGVNDYIVTDEGKMTLFDTLESLGAAYSGEDIKAHTLEEVRRVGESIIVAASRFQPKTGAIVSSVHEIPQYSKNPFKSKQYERDIKAPWVETDPNSNTYLWKCYTHKVNRGVVCLYTVGFQHGNIIKVDKNILEENVGRAFYPRRRGGDSRTPPYAPTGFRFSLAEAIIYYSVLATLVVAGFIYLKGKRRKRFKEKATRMS